ncbi:hypothetical protein FQ087_01060 [Sporosarcina sp. ANT_H38]|uniref:hypothetical protein n=1 Tax=Sporosarcina sp. ANT_H38 TaxID=2597358 RepID=UPI0011F1197B|nr:hypothetical protein [Sporosarcina sp. ANT_H38]KAA0964945.1 hypothetical protein FQ087_01060 [Sporosarcina sp. ANT_H38]
MQIHRNVKQEDVGLFVEKVFGENEDLIRNFFASMRSDMNEGIYSVENVNRMVVAASMHCNIWHPYCVYVRLAFDFNCVDERAIQFMIEFLKDEVEKPLFFLIDNRFRGLGELLTRKDFRLIRKTEVININPKSFLSVKDDSDQEIITVGQILNDTVLLSSLIKICKKIYTETHVDNPVADLSSLSWKNVILDDLIDSSSYVVVNENNVIAFSLMYEGEENSWELGWVGVENSDEMTLLNLVLNKQLRDANEQNIKYIEKEVDSTCPYSLHIAKSLSYDVSETWYAYVQT